MKGLLVTILILAVIGIAIYLWMDGDAELNNGETVFCTLDAMLCPGGSYVGRVPPACEFAECPLPSTSTTTATSTSLNLDAYLLRAN